MIGEGAPFVSHDEVGRWLQVHDWATAVITDIASVPVHSDAGLGLQEGMLKVAATLRARTEATLDTLDPEWRAIAGALNAMLGGPR